MTLTGADILIKALIDQEVDTVFGYPGGAVLPIYDALFKQNSIKHILVRHEQAAVHAAEGYARSTGKVGVVLVTSGPGATNTITGLADAMMDSVPLVCLAGQVPTHMIGNDAFQEADITGITRPCTKHNYLVKDVETLAPTVHEAFYIARTGRPGPVLIDIPKDVSNAKGEYRGLVTPDRPSYRPKMKADTHLVEEAVALIASAKKPIFYTGGGVINSGERASKLLIEFVRLTGYPITNTLMGLGGYPASDPLFVGMLGMHGTLEANLCMAGCDVMIAIGARFDDRVTGRIDGFSPHSKKIHVDIDSSSINKNVKVDLPIVGDSAAVLEAMIHEWKKKKYQPNAGAIASWWKQIEKWRKKDCYRYEPAKDAIKPQYALERLHALTKERDTYVTTDVGQHQMWAAQLLRFEKPKRWMTSGGLGTMGYGLPAAMGVQAAHPDSTVICVSGDASVMMNIQELSTLVQYRLPVKLVILNNGYMGMVRQWQEMFHGNRYSQSYMEALPDFVKLAEAFGLRGIRAAKPGEVDQAIADTLEHDGPVVLDMVVTAEENVYPMIPAGHAHHEVILGPGRMLELKEEEGMILV